MPRESVDSRAQKIAEVVSNFLVLKELTTS